MTLVCARGRQAELKEVVREQKDSNDRLKVLTDDFHVLLAKNSPAST